MPRPGWSGMFELLCWSGAEAQSEQRQPEKPPLKRLLIEESEFNQLRLINSNNEYQLFVFFIIIEILNLRL
jgi:hypothetical protein